MVFGVRDVDFAVRRGENSVRPRELAFQRIAIGTVTSLAGTD
jgi:hypothetical protein